VKPVRTGLGYRNITRAESLVDHTLKVEPGTVFYLFTDGVQDHMGGQPRRLLGRRRLAAMLAERPQDEDLGEQLQVLQGNLDAYRGENTRRDDMTMIAFKPL
jgi:serine phosphatase RsbU (regulator of sigma subunit)